MMHSYTLFRTRFLNNSNSLISLFHLLFIFDVIVYSK